MTQLGRELPIQPESATAACLITELIKFLHRISD